MSSVINASQQKPAVLFTSGTTTNRVVQTRVTERVRVYWARDSGRALVRVRILDGTQAGTIGFVRRNEVTYDRDEFVRTQVELANLAGAMRDEEFYDRRRVARPVPFQYPSDMCWARAHLMADLLRASGYKVEKVFLVYANHGLRVATVFGDDLADLSDSPAVTWWYHIAPIVFLDDTSQPYVIDPSVLDGPQKTGDWAAKMTAKPIDRMMYSEMVSKLMGNGRYPASPTDQPWLVYTDPAIAAPPRLSDVTTQVGKTPDEVTVALEFAADRMPQRLAVGALNTLSNNWNAAVDADATKRDAPDPYPGYKTDLQRARTRFGKLTPWDRRQVAKDYKLWLIDVWGTFTGSGVGGDIKKLVGSLPNALGAV
jgi:hypothetical protein